MVPTANFHKIYNNVHLNFAFILQATCHEQITSFFFIVFAKKTIFQHKLTKTYFAVKNLFHYPPTKHKKVYKNLKRKQLIRISCFVCTNIQTVLPGAKT